MSKTPVEPSSAVFSTVHRLAKIDQETGNAGEFITAGIDGGVIGMLAQVPSLVEVRRVLGPEVANKIVEVFKLVIRPLLQGYYSKDALESATEVDVLVAGPAMVFAAVELSRRKILTSIGSHEALALISTQVDRSWGDQQFVGIPLGHRQY